MNSIWGLFPSKFPPSNSLPSWAREGEHTTQLQAEQTQEEQSRPLMDEEGKAEQSGFQRRRRASKICSRRILLPCPTLAITIILSILLGAATVGIAGLHRDKSAADHEHTTVGSVMVQPCGSTPAEARARGCHFDVISFCWLPDACYDAELSSGFLHEHKLEWFEDPAKEQPLSYEEIMTGEHTGLYVNWEYHVAHCTAMWRKMHRAILGDLGKAAIDEYIGVYAHTAHCEEMLLGGRGVAFETINTRIAVKYPNCGIE
ncbi:hypothetical protein MGN70_005947 [Eutypa lata]|nr:hypothetical protein MGN70_005947 [Eutypa lata]